MKTKQCPLCHGTGEVDDPGVLSAHLISFRKEAGLSQEEVAEKMGFTKSYVSHLENGSRPWTADRVNSYLLAVGKTALPIKIKPHATEHLIWRGKDHVTIAASGSLYADWVIQPLITGECLVNVDWWGYVSSDYIDPFGLFDSLDEAQRMVLQAEEAICRLVSGIDPKPDDVLILLRLLRIVNSGSK